MEANRYLMQVQEVPDPVPSAKTMREFLKAYRNWEARQPGRKFGIREVISMSARSALAKKQAEGEK